MLNNLDFIIDIALLLVSLGITIFMFIKNHNNKLIGLIVTIIFIVKIIIKII